MIYEATIQYITIDNDGNDKSKKESFVVENQNFFAEVENALHNEFEAYTDLDVVAIKRSKIKEIVNTRQSNDDLIWLAEMMDVFLTDEGDEKQMKYKVLVFAKTFDSAKAIMSDYMKQGFDMSLISLKLSKFIDVLI